MVLASYMFSWTIGAFFGVPSFLGIGLFVIAGFFTIFSLSSHPSLRCALETLRCNKGLTLLMVIFLLISFYQGDQKDIIWIAFGISCLYVYQFLDIKLGDRFCVGFAHVTVLGALFYLIFNREAVYYAEVYGDVSRTSFSEDNQAYTLIAYAAAFGIIASAHALLRSYLGLVLGTASIVACVASVILAGTRSVYSGLAISIVYLLVADRHYVSVRRLFLYTTALIMIFVFLALSGLFSERLQLLQESIREGFYTILGGDSLGIDPSALGRVFQREYASYLLAENPLFGAGFKAYWVDFPLLQAYSDLGIFIGFFYTVAFLIVPVFIAVRSTRRSNPGHILLAALYLLNMPRLFLHGQPYDWVLFAYVFLVYAIRPNRSHQSAPRGG